jgi:ribosomal protein S18 acetylase RimI-like enzyme
MARADVEQVREVWRDRWGEFGDDDDEWLHTSLDSDEATKTFVAVDGGRVLGFVTVTIGGPDYVGGYFEAASMSEHAVDDDRNGVIHMLCVRAGSEGEGLGTRLLNVGQLSLTNAACERLFAVSWRRESHRDSHTLFERAGFEPVATIEHHYRGHRDNCPDCDEACECSATFYVRNTGESPTSTGSEGVRP